MADALASPIHDAKQSNGEDSIEQPGTTTMTKNPEQPILPKELTTEISLDVAESPSQQDAQNEATAAIREAVARIRALKVTETTTVNMSNDFDDLMKAIDEFQSPSPTTTDRSFSPPPFAMSETRQSCTVKRHLMDEWRWESSPNSYPSFVQRKPPMRPAHVIPPPKSVIEVYYRSLPSIPACTNKLYTDEDFKAAHGDARATEKPQRIKINSSLLLDDLERISGLSLPALPHTMIPPFKLIIHNWGAIKSTLEKLKSQLEDLKPDKETTQTTASSEAAQASRESFNSTPTEGAVTANATDEQVPVNESAAAANTDQNIETSSTNGETSESESSSNDRKSSNSDDEKENGLELRVAHLQCLHDFVCTELGHLLGLGLKIQEASLEKITFEEVYHLYSPGDLIIDRNADVDILHQVYAVTGGRMRLGRYVNQNTFRSPAQEEEADDSPEAGIGTWTDVVVECFRMHWNGTKIGPIRKTHRVQHFTGEKNITDLDLYPVRFLKGFEDMCSTVRLRGRAVLECFGHKKYDGLTATPPQYHRPLGNRVYAPPPPAGVFQIGGREPFRIRDAQREIEGDVYVDVKTFHQPLPQHNHEFDHLRRVRSSTREVTEMTSSEERDYYIGDHDVDAARSDSFLAAHFHLTNPNKPADLCSIEDHVVLLPHCIPGYDFRRREWVWLDVQKIEEIDKSDEARRRGWDDLVLNEGYNQLLLSLVDNHTSAADYKRKKSVAGHNVPTSQIDLIKGKGRGLIILLHGPPGTGKTSTAETIAAYTGKPLYAITCGDIGVSAREVEDTLYEHTQRAEKWECVLLLDEADVFLARRTWTDMNRNAVVSVFLRHLEYYSGILFLTTNIVGIIDEAFKSRIHVALRYDTINALSTERIWSNILDRIVKENKDADVKIKFDRDVLLEFAQTHYGKHEVDETTWNARQIRNAFSIAIAMGQSDRLGRIRNEGLRPEDVAKSGRKSLMVIRLTHRNFAKIADTATDFDMYINAVRGPDGGNALANQQRDDYFGRPPLAPPHRKHRGLGDHGQPSRRQDFVASNRSFQGKKAVKKRVEMDDEEDDDERASRANESRLRKEEFSESDGWDD